MNNNKDRLDLLEQRLKTRQPHILDHEFFHKSAVLIPMMSVEGEMHILFEVRSHQLRRQPGEICFPGGRVDAADNSMQDTAIRETCEELGIQENQVEVIAALDFLPLAHHSIVYPFAGCINHETQMTPNPEEVAEVFSVPIQHFLEHEPERYDLHLIPEPEENFPYHLIPKGEKYDWRKASLPEYFYYYQDYVIWGLTARILRHFVDLYKTAMD
ncbi:NUDIX hydrolase [Caldalkalibacillus salinus]|uniref:NUDIX hydrolase n=1 Tax=Caldalkalibacillus salinus TaxID=2803787 RepID=UPI0019241C1F|nr:CoA pyrophosphatase [Caldalkalibacillus salinus]